MRSCHIMVALCWFLMMAGCAAVIDRPGEPWPGADAALAEVGAGISGGPSEWRRNREQRDRLRERATLDGDLDAAWQLRNAYLGQADHARAYVWLKFLAKNKDGHAIALLEADRYALTYEESMLLFSDNDEDITKVTGRCGVRGSVSGHLKISQ